MNKTARCVVATTFLVLAACTTSPKSHRANSAIDPGTYDIACTGGFDAPPRLVSGKVPVFPASMLNPELIDDRKVRRLPMQWPVRADFTVMADGVPTAITSTATTPPSFGIHMRVAVREWRFAPARQAGAPVQARCSGSFTFVLD